MRELGRNDLVLDLADVDGDAVALAGGKAASLGALTRQGFRIPGGFVVTTTAFRRFVERVDLRDELAGARAALHSGKIPALGAVCERLRARIAGAPLPTELATVLATTLEGAGNAWFAVRSSAAMEDGRDDSWAGQLETLLWIPASGVGRALRHVWASLFSERALGYGFERDRRSIDAPAIAVVVQQMVEADHAGVGFSIHPTNQAAGTLLIEAVHGLGEAAVDGAVTPDGYELARPSLELIRRSPHRQVQSRQRAPGGGTCWVPLPDAARALPVLLASQIRAIGRTLVDLEQRSGHPVDIEWAIAKDQLYLLQCRPVTALDQPAALGAGAAAGSGIDIEIDIGRPPAELDLSSIQWHFIHRRRRTPFFAGLYFGGIVRQAIDLGVDYRLDRLGIFLDAVACDQAAWDALAYRMALRFDDDLGWFGRMIERCHHEHAVAEAGWRRMAEIDWATRDRATIADGIAAYVESCAVFSAFICWPVLAEIELERRLHARLEATFGDGAAAAFEIATDPVRAGSVLEERLELLAIAAELAAGRPIDAALARHTERHGWMKNVGYVGELHTQAHYLREVTAAAAMAPEAVARGLRNEQADKARRLADLIERAGAGSELATLITIANDLVYFRSYRAEIFYRSFVHVQRLLAAGAAAVGVSPKDMLYLLPDELIGALRAGELAPLDRIADRRRGYLYLNDAVLGPIIHGGQEAIRRCPSIDEGGDPSAGDELRGQTAFAGRIRGRVAVVRSLSELELVQPGDVLVTHATNIDYVSTLHRVAAIVTEEGGILCHAAVVSRELRIPAVMGTGNATKILHTGDLVEVDAVAGVVRRLAHTP